MRNFQAIWLEGYWCMLHWRRLIRTFSNPVSTSIWWHWLTLDGSQSDAHNTVLGTLMPASYVNQALCQKSYNHTITAVSLQEDDQQVYGALYWQAYMYILGTVNISLLRTYWIKKTCSLPTTLHTTILNLWIKNTFTQKAFVVVTRVSIAKDISTVLWFKTHSKVNCRWETHVAITIAMK